MNERILVVGANGFIGINLVSELVSNKIPVTALVKNNTNTNELKKAGCYNILSTNNFNDASIISQLILSKPKYIINCAWEKTNVDKLSALTNTKNLLELINLAKKIKTEGFINIGTYEEYGFFEENINEKSPVSPVTDFGKLKYAHNLTLFELAKSFDLKACHLRVSEIYALDRPEDFFIKKLIKSISKKIDFNTSIVNEKKDYIYVLDLCRAIILLIKSEASGVFNIGSGQSNWNKDLINMIVKKTNCKNYFDIQEAKNKEKFSLNIEKIYKKTGWKPTVSIWNGIDMLLQEEKFKNINTFENFTKTIRSIYS